MKKRTAIYPGTFDPITLGHLDILKRALKIFDNVTLAITNNPSKLPLFSLDERLLLAKRAIKNLKGAKVKPFNSLLARFTKSQNALAIVRGLRQVSDFEDEFQLATINRKLNPSVETVFIMTNEKYFYLTSSLVKELALFNAPLNEFVPKFVEKRLKNKLSDLYVV